MKLSLSLHLSIKVRITYIVANTFKTCLAFTAELEKCTFKKGAMYTTYMQSAFLLFLLYACC